MYKVFIVDDEPFIIEGLYDIVDWPKFGLEIVGHAENGQQALDALGSTPVDVLITDISMPVMNGLTLISEARKLHQELKVIILSGFNEFDYLKEGMKLGIENYLLKPINLEELESTLRNTVQKLDSLQSDGLYDAYDVQILKDNTLYRWLNGQIAAAEFEERAELLGLNLHGPCAAVSVLRTDGNSAEVFERTERYLKEQRGITLFRDVDGDIVIVGSLPKGAVEKRIFAELMENLSLELSVMNRMIQIGVGSVGRLPEAASLSYKEAKRALEYYLIYPDRRTIEYKLLEGDHGGNSVLESGYPLAWEEYAKLILAKDKEGLKECIYRDFEQLKQLEGVRPEDLQNAALELVVRFKMELQHIKYTEETDLFKKALQRVQRCETYQGLIEILEGLAEETVCSLLQDAKNPVVHQVLTYIDTHYADELSLKTLGAQYHIHPVYLGQLFHKETGVSFAEYINKYRIDKAKLQLKNTNLKVQEIARKVGYWEIGYFYKQFRKYVGISPTDFKALH
ncbi:response regulator transcription factor [Paenibacillus sp. DXFW5]|uniref:Response regulator transcription factor n=1 Tax=Paenibacillus rhizolycopersici TaxID=2780073 RepID=A0ABS2H0A6_9BACL|nr:response regulator transcription factor [Paenibacillus rhizolycopersici]MBM6994687.1 response regulator transcription factor [Paenibacillus rhizolycopersici]